MTLKIALTAVALTVLPAVASAACQWGKEHQAQSCAPGTQWDDSSQACVQIVNS